MKLLALVFLAFTWYAAGLLTFRLHQRLFDRALLLDLAAQLVVYCVIGWPLFLLFYLCVGVYLALAAVSRWLSGWDY